MTPQQRTQLEADALRFGLKDPESLFAQEEFKATLQAKGFTVTREPDFWDDEEDSERPAGRRLIFHGRKEYLLHLRVEPLALFVHVRRTDREQPPLQLAAYWKTLPAKVWELALANILAAEQRSED